jgi:hypothetical protein
LEFRAEEVPALEASKDFTSMDEKGEKESSWAYAVGDIRRINSKKVRSKKTVTLRPTQWLNPESFSNLSAMTSSPASMN